MCRQWDGTNGKAQQADDLLGSMLAEWTGLEPATPGVTGRYSNQLNYHSLWLPPRLRAVQVPYDLASPRGFEPL